MQQQLEFYARNGYLVVPGAMTAAEVQTANEAIDRDLVENRAFWSDKGNGRLQSTYSLLAQADLDFTMRPAGLLPLMSAILGEEICADEHSVMIRQGSPQSTECVWHRDTRRTGEAPYFTPFLSVVFYLSDVDESSHTFSVVPGSGQSAEQAPLESYDLTLARHLTGPAGTAIFFNAAMLHAGCVRITPHERRTIHIYCGRLSAPPVSSHTLFPRRLWEGKDDATRRYYSRLNDLTRLVAQRF
jgi:ectoine hydroxylase-related dioxygenase (phytanoyl-CoA dioxygenase family)